MVEVVGLLMMLVCVVFMWLCVECVLVDGLNWVFVVLLMMFDMFDELCDVWIVFEGCIVECVCVWMIDV